MKKGIHPKYYRCKVTCMTCGNTFETGATVPEIKVDTCSNCHSFYTGKLSYTSDSGRVAKFRKKMAAADAAQNAAALAADTKTK
jgi:large subunit ribosomal protein L31